MFSTPSRINVFSRVASMIVASKALFYVFSTPSIINVFFVVEAGCVYKLVEMGGVPRIKLSQVPKP